MLKVKDIVSAIEQLAPPELAESWDNVGLMTGDLDQRVTTVFLCLDVTSDNVQQAIACGADLIVSHHPLIFSPVKRIIEQDVSGSILRNLIRHDISVYSAHTNLDHADGGMNDMLAKRLSLQQIRHFSDEECTDGTGRPLDAIGRVGVLPAPMEMGDFVELVKDSLGCQTIRSVGNPEEVIKIAALCSGAGGDGIYAAYHAGADVYVTADVKHHEAQLAFELGMNLIDAGHFETENIICSFMADFLESRFQSLNIIASDAQPYFK
ncbi:Nif3-like dinuclear metal center hexameric protein [Ructibacterium gallinarum]|uniref:GTP cyclohydrolase 1 type 2 homolog n=1 Tax=Ructibacterium gallinarum TaxID=2779355 RepID=A0A9D5M5L6_9FIRM|nr:Nif3-like dinuclear metal center hexameric protein [Ructibacterium gallinarum]MBE5039979.1 Nif3-like dinuclear metal center hexameric protein [Ructibacterium gallinarum]